MRVDYLLEFNQALLNRAAADAATIETLREDAEDIRKLIKLFESTVILLDQTIIRMDRLRGLSLTMASETYHVADHDNPDGQKLPGIITRKAPVQEGLDDV